MLDDFGPNLDEARARIEATRNELQAVLARLMQISRVRLGGSMGS